MTENEVSGVILDSAIKVHRALGPGLLESVYESALGYELTKRGLKVERQKLIPVVYDGIPLGEGLRADLVVEGLVIVELKSIESVPAVAYKVLLTYLRLSNMRLGLLINFGDEYIKDGIHRVVNQLA
jgi:GxxExxY protein